MLFLVDLISQGIVLAKGLELDLFDNSQQKNAVRLRSELMLPLDQMNIKFGKCRLRVVSTGLG